MTDDNTTESTQEHPARVDDPRFEVKWRKKGSSNPAASSAAGMETPASTAVSDGEVDELRRELEKERERTKDLHDRWQRSAADLVNLRRRTEQEREEVERFASMYLVAELLPVLDNFERALATVPGNLAMLTWIQGVALVERHMRAILEQRGLAPIEAQGQPFNPHLHEAVGEREQEGVAPGTVLQEYQKGYTMHGRVIRPTLVEIAAAPQQQAAPSAPEVAPEASRPPTTETAEAEQIAEEAESEIPGP
ncbi:MAG TPA: nucleotide exchange factor GrpE [Chloroflexota bacterium]